MLKILWFLFSFRSILYPMQRCTPMYNAKINDSASSIAAKLNPALTVVVTPSAAKERIDSFLASTYSKFSRTYITDLINSGHVFVNETRKKPSYRLRIGDVVQIMSNDFDRNKSRGVNLKLDVLYEDEYMMIINKAPGMIVHPGAGCPNETVANAVEFYINNKSQNAESIATSIPPEDYATSVLDSLQSSESFGNHIVHRLDKGSSGVLLIGKNKRITSILSKQFASRDVVKYYLAVCVGNPGDTTIAEAIGRSSTDRKKMAVTTKGEGKAAVSHVVSLLFDGQLSAAMVRIDTGSVRTHQIRVHMKQRRTPILGDDQYGSNKWNRQLVHGNRGLSRRESSSQIRTQLHAYETHFTHPVTGKRMSVRAPLPADIRTLINRIGMKNLHASSALPMYFTSRNRTEDQQVVRVVASDLPDPLRDSEQMLESRERVLQRKLIDVVNKTSGLLQGCTEVLYASLQRMSDQYRQQQEAEKRVKKTVSEHGYKGSKGFYVAEDAVASSLGAAGDISRGVSYWHEENGVGGGEVDLDEVWGEYEEDEGGRDGHRVNTGEQHLIGDDDDDVDEYDDEEEFGGGFIIEEEDSVGFDDDDDIDTDTYDDMGTEEDNDCDDDCGETDSAQQEEEIAVAEAEEEEEEDDWSVDDITSRSTDSDTDDNDDGYGDDEDEEVDFSAVRGWR